MFYTSVSIHVQTSLKNNLRFQGQPPQQTSQVPMAMSHILIRNQEKEQRKEWEFKLRLQNLAQIDRC